MKAGRGWPPCLCFAWLLLGVGVAGAADATNGTNLSSITDATNGTNTYAITDATNGTNLSSITDATNGTNTYAITDATNGTNLSSITDGTNVTNLTNGSTPAVTTATAKNATLLKLNVTLGGFAVNQTALTLPGRWGAAAAWEATEESTGECPYGRWCPGGIGAPKVCKAGLYSPYRKRVVPCGEGEVCSSGSYCPDPGVKKECPRNTESRFGSTSQLDCRCLDGYECLYRRQVNLNMILHVPLGVWLSESGKAIRDKVLQAVAESAGVGVKDVQIDQVLPYLGMGGGSRRLLGNINNQDALLLRFTLHGAEKVGENALQTRISEILLPRRIRMRTRARAVGSVHWARADRVHVKPSKIWAKKSHW